VRKSFEDYYPKVVSEGQPSCLSEIGHVREQTLKVKCWSKFWLHAFFCKPLHFSDASLWCTNQWIHNGGNINSV